MFFHLELDREIELQPRFFGPRLAEVLQQKLRSEVGRPAAHSAPDAAALPCKYAVQRARAGVTRRTCAPQIEGTCSGRYGFIIAVTNVLSMGKGMIREGTGSASFNVKYMCLVFRPFRGEVIDCVVSSVNKARAPVRPATGTLSTSLLCACVQKHALSRSRAGLRALGLLQRWRLGGHGGPLTRTRA
jgi:DNA-directed RNA polymerase subunit E'/Rpb7